MHHEPVLQMLGKYDKNYTLSINGSEFEFGLNMKKVRKILMATLIVFFIPNFTFFVFLLYTYINKIKDFTRKQNYFYYNYLCHNEYYTFLVDRFVF